MRNSGPGPHALAVRFEAMRNFVLTWVVKTAFMSMMDKKHTRKRQRVDRTNLQGQIPKLFDCAAHPASWIIQNIVHSFYRWLCIYNDSKQTKTVVKAMHHVKMHFFFWCIECKSPRNTSRVACFLTFSEILLYLVVANGAAIITVTCQMVCEFCYPKEASPHGVVDTLKNTFHKCGASTALNRLG